LIDFAGLGVPASLAMPRPRKRAGRASALLPWVLALPLATPLAASAQGAGDPAGAAAPLRERDRLGGDWGGARDSLAQRGVTVDLWTTGFTQAMFEGTGDNGWDIGGRADLLLDADTARLGLWQGGGLHAHLEYRGGNLPGERGGATLPVHAGGHFAIDSEDDLVATSLYASQRFGDATRLMLGKINMIDLLARHPFHGGWGTDRFHNVALVIPPNGITPPVIKGAILTHSFAPYTLTAMVFDPNDRSSSSAIGDLFEDGVSVSLGLTWSGELARRRSTAGISAVYSTAEGIDYRDLGLPPGTESREPATRDGSYNLLIEGSHLLLESGSAPGQGLGLYARAALADGNPNLVKGMFAAGIAGHALVPGRPNDYFGVGYFYYNFSDVLQNALRPSRLFENEQGVEAYYTFVPVPWLRLSAQLQWVDPAEGANETIWIAGLRARIAF
jgi:porin